MNAARKKVRIGIIGCGAIGSRFARSVHKELKQDCQLSALYDIHPEKSTQLARSLSQPKIAKSSYQELLRGCDFLIEAVTSQNTAEIIRQALKAKKNVLAMSVGQLLNAQDLFALAKKNKCALLIPSGAIAGLDAVKAASLAGIKTVRLTSRKPPSGFAGSTYIEEKGIDLQGITSETVIFEGNVDSAVKHFPKNINVAATLALACGSKEKVSIRITTSPEFKTNSHEIEVTGDSGRIVSLTDNVVCPDNPKTSYLAVLSAVQTLKQFFSGVKIGT